MISIIIPTLNEEKVISKTLGMLQGLDKDKYEVIVSDGGSTDKTQSIALNLADHLVVPETKDRQTISIGRNLGGKKAKGEFLVFLDADVYIHQPDLFFDRCLALFNKDPNLAGLSVFLKVLPEHATFFDHLFFTLMNWFYYISNNIFKSGAAGGEFQMVKKSVFDQLGGFNEKLVATEDNDFFNRVSKVGKTMMSAKLFVSHTSRRAHAVGWPHLLSLWLMNTVSTKIFKKSYSKEWKVIR